MKPSSGEYYEFTDFTEEMLAVSLLVSSFHKFMC